MLRDFPYPKPILLFVGKPARRWVAIFLLLPALQGCGSVLCNHCTRENEPKPSDSSAECTRATITGLTPEALPNRVFVGIAMSGGGSRAANFSSAVLLELDELGILPTAAAISSVSGSSLTNAYYARWGRSEQRQQHWNREELKRRLNENIQTQWELHWFFPQNIVKYWTTDFDRSDIMKKIFDDLLFDSTDARFRDAGTRQCNAEPHSIAAKPFDLPVVLINATTLAGSNFVFTDEDFRAKLDSRLDSYPLSHAIMASAAFPGAFQNVTLQNYKEAHLYQHLFDGGPSDNLGVEALQKTLRQLDGRRRSGESLRGCMFILVDSFTDSARDKKNEKSHSSDTRKMFDFIVSDNVDNAFDAMLAHRREDTLRDLDLHFDSPADIGKLALWEYRPFRDMDGPDTGLVCHVWHLTFQHLPNLPAVPEAEKLATQVNKIETAFRLGSFFGQKKVEQQDALYKAAHILTREDSETVGKVLQLFRDWDLVENH